MTNREAGGPHRTDLRAKESRQEYQMFLEVENLTKSYGQGESRAKVLKGITTGVEQG